MKRERRIKGFYIILSLALFVFFLRLIQLTIIKGAEYSSLVGDTVLMRYDVPADRGEILDRDGNLLVANEVSYDLQLQRPFLPPEELNSILLQLVIMFDEVGYTPPTVALPSNPQSLFEQYGIQNFMTGYRETICGIRLRMEQHNYNYLTPYNVAQDIGEELLHMVLENGDLLKGVEVIETSKRLIPDGTLMPHILGTAGPILAEDYEQLRAQGYSLGDTVGRSGVERAMEQYIRGVDGEVAVERDSTGALVSFVETRPIVPGDTVTLTVDSELQRTTWASLARIIGELNTYNIPADAGAAVVMEVNTGAVLAATTYPSYDANLLSTDYENIASTPGEPLFNRAFMGLYRPGSSFKPAVAISSQMGGISADETVVCTGTYTHYADTGFTPGCTGVHGHVDLERALQVSCNVYFYEMGRRLTINTFMEDAYALGLGRDTEFELPAATGTLSTPEQREQDGLPWYEGDVVQAAIGQGDTSVTMLQLAQYASALASAGDVPQPHIVESIRSYDNTETIYEASGDPIRVLYQDSSIYQNIEDGMVAASRMGQAAEFLSQLPFEVAIKTGTPQSAEGHFDSVIVAYGPADNPQIAVAAVIEKGANGYELGELVMDVFNAYYASGAMQTTTAGFNGLKP